MGFFSSLVGIDQSMGALNAVMAKYFLTMLASNSERRNIAEDVSKILLSKRGNQKPESLMQELNNEPLVVQMNFVALACINLGFSAPSHKEEWVWIGNPYQLKQSIKERHITIAVDMLKNSGIVTEWTGDKIDFLRMYQTGECWFK